MNRRNFLRVIGGAGLLLPSKLRLALGSTQIPQTALAGKSVPQFLEPLPVFGPASGGALQRVYSPDVTVAIEELQQMVLPASFYQNLSAPYRQGTWVWAYRVGPNAPALYPGVTVEARRGVPTTITYLNELPMPSQIQKYITLDQTIHWANPLGLAMDDPLRRNPYTGPPPTVAHLHGAEVSSRYDGGPDQWFTPTGLHGGGYDSISPLSNGAVYEYPNGQEATTLWFHDHTLGATRLNVYAGLAAFYLLRDDYDTGLPENPLGLPAGAQEIEIVIQDRQFDTNGQWFFPDGAEPEEGLNGPPPNEEIHPFWNPEFFGDVIVVNGKSWPYLNVEPRRYRFRLLDGSNARFYELRLENRATHKPGPGFWIVGTDGGLLDTPVLLNDPNAPGGKSPRLLIAPGERYDIIVDFSGYAGQTLTLVNSAKAPYPNGLTADPQTTGQIMQFRVGTGQVNDTTYNPATGGPLRKAGAMPPIIRLANPATGQPAQGVAPNQVRQLALMEVEGAGGPVEVLVNNTKWTGVREDTDPPMPLPGSVPDGHGNFLTELPRVGSTEVWEIINLTGDAHPIHLHLVQFQLMSRQSFNVTQYRSSYEAAFPGGTFGEDTYPPGVFIPGYGPPNDYNVPNGAGALGGNPDVTPYLQGRPSPPLPEEAGWKDTVKMYPGTVSRIVVRFAPQDVAVGAASPGVNLYPFDPTEGPGYVWHCHIIDHEDNEMMRPYLPVD